MNPDDLHRLVRRAFGGEGASGREEFELELEALADDHARQALEQAEEDDRNMFRLREALRRPEPWYRSTTFAMAASALLGAGLTLLVTGTQEMDAGGVVSSSVHYLETTRSASTEDLPVVSLEARQRWVTLVVYPAYDDFSDLVVDVQRQTGDVAAASNEAWSTVWTSHADAGNREAVVVSLRRSLLSPGIHRLIVTGVSPDTSLPIASLQFRVADAAGH